MVVQDKSIKQLKEIRENFTIHLNNLNPQLLVRAKTINKVIWRKRELSLSSGSDEDKKFALVDFIGELDELIYRTYSDLVVNSEKNNDFDEAVEHMNKYIANQLVPYSEGIDLQKWKRDYRDWKMGNKEEARERDLLFQFQMLHIKFRGYLIGK